MVHVVWTDTGRASGGTEVGNEVRLTVVTVQGRLQPDSTTAFRPGPGRASDCDDSETDSVTASAWQGWHPIHRHRSSLRRPVDLGQARIQSPLTTVKQACLGTSDSWHLFGAGIGWYALYLPVDHIC